MRLADVAWPEVGERPTVMVPLGSTEQHGPHLPLSTDSIIATHVASAAAAALSAEGPVTVAPALTYGASGEHHDFPGTVSIGSSALTGTLVEMVRSLAIWAGRVVFINGHGGNVQAVSTATRALRGEGHQVTWVPCLTPPGADSHAGRTETSLLMHLAPELVRVDQISSGLTTPLALIFSQLQRQGIRALSPTGVLGDPTPATADEGKRVFGWMVTAVVTRVRQGTIDDDGRLVTDERGSR